MTSTTTQATTQALEGIRILDLSWGIAGPLGVLLLAEHGADVIKIERPGGAPLGSHGGSHVWDRSRRSVSLDLKTAAGADHFRRLVANADVVVESFRPGVLAKLGLASEVLRADNPRLIVLSCPPYPEGHRRAARHGYDALIQASGGQMTDQPGWRDGPIMLHLPLPSMGAAYLVSCGVLAALSARERTGVGQHVETSLFQGALLFTSQIWQDVESPPPGYHEVMAKTYPPGVHQAMLFECADGEWLHLSALSGLTPLASLDEVVGPDGGDDLWARIRTRNRDELVDALRANNHAADAVTPAADMLRHIQTLANEMAVEVIDPEVGPTTQMGVPIHLLGTPGRVQGPRPRPGQHTAELLAEAPMTGGTSPPPPTPRGAPLDGIRVIDFGQYLAGPFAPMILSDLGADVIKIEPVSGDSMRFAGKPFIGCQRGKRSLALDLKQAAGREVAERLIARSDIVHHNMTRGVATKLGIDYEACRAQRPDIIYCNTYAYGLADPLGRSGGLDPLYQASSGIEYEAGAAHTGNQPLYLRFGMCDTGNAMLSVVGVLLALFHRQRTGVGQELWTSLHDAGIVFSSDVWVDADGRPWDRPHLDAGLHGLDPGYRLYRTKGGGWICVAAVTDAEWASLGGAVGIEPIDRADAAAGLAIEDAMLGRTALEWTRTFDARGVPNEIPVDSLDGAAALNDSDNVRLGLVADYQHAMLGRLRQLGRLWSFSDTPERIAGPPPLAGEHSRDILREVGYRDTDIDTLIGSGVVYAADDQYRDRFTT